MAAFSNFEQLQQELEVVRQALIEAQQGQRQAEQRQREAEQERELERRRTQQTTLDEFLEACHVHISKPLTVQTDKSLTTGGGVTNPNNRHYPQNLQQWINFPETQARLFHTVHDVFHPHSEPPARLFDPIIHLEVLGPKLCDRPLASEADLQYYQRPAVEQPVTNIIAALRNGSLSGIIDVGNGIIFESHSNSLSEKNEEVQQRYQQRQQRRQAEGQSTETWLRPTYTDQICVYNDTNGMRNPLFIIEYKPPHKLSVGDILWGLRGDMDIREVIERDTIPMDLTERSEHNSDEVMAAVLTQTFHYMIQCGLEYSYITTGEAFVFLRIKEEDPTTLYYHITVPKEEADMHEDPMSRGLHTAVGQVLSFCLLSLQSQRRSKSWQARAYKLLEKWPVSRAFHETPQSERVDTPEASEFMMKLRSLTPRSFGLRRRIGGKATCAKVEVVSKEDDSSDDSQDMHTPSKASRGLPKPRSSVSLASTGKPVSSQTGTQSQQYCTQACLLGLKRGYALDQNCPNVSSHPGTENGNRHAVGIERFKALVREQLATNLDQDCEPLGKQGARGALFKITLTSHGYTFVSKGTVSVFVPDLQHEGRIYQRLEAIQGEVVPVHLGNINLVRKYDLDLGVRIVHMLLMSWAGEVISDAEMANSKEEVVQLVDALRAQGVDHKDVRVPNIVWNLERCRPMLIDFERSAITSPDCNFVGVKALQEISPNRQRKRLSPIKAFRGSESVQRGTSLM